ncbi:hypothetical protein [Mesorhizobium sp.]|uniref:hypothetical protein n=1 Tax=Mesorhizobium sp. TaxID=1871066 RepID=UPI00121E339A|nr:hypothetical protein [Mesorhizobium sp.]TIO74964.1 MAG: hypothetical protein E5X75_21370 [Mesorhizobium sp.]
MSGQDAIRGFAIQTLICMLDALRIDSSDWIGVTIEPDIAGEKVDILWEFPGRKLAQQVKSSKNQIGRAAVEGWCLDLKSSHSADEYQLILAGPIAAAVLEDAPFHGVGVPIPTSMDTLALIDQAVTKLDRYLSNKTFPPIPLPIREAIISLISARLTDNAIRAQRVDRQMFDGWLQQWILSAYPEAVNQRLSANCEILWSSIQILGPQKIASRAFDIVLPVTVLNAGITVAVVEWLALKATADGMNMLYQPNSYLPPSWAGGQEFRTTATPFTELAINPNNSVSLELLLTPVEREGYEERLWSEATVDLELWAKYRNLPQPTFVKKAPISITTDNRSVLTSRQPCLIKLGGSSSLLGLL